MFCYILLTVYKTNDKIVSMMNEMKENMKNSIVGFRLPRFEEITNDGLYLEQTVKYINFFLEPLGEPEITASMISNYVKHKLVKAPERKQYFAEHIACLIFIAVVKQVVALDDIRVMFGVQTESYDIKTAYNEFCDEFENTLYFAFGTTETYAQLGKTTSDAKDLLRNAINAVVTKIYLDKYVSAFRQIETVSHQI